MISYIKGVPKYYDNGKVTILAGNLGWLVNIGNLAIDKDQELELFIHTALRENDISLWGFKTKTELEVFNLLLNVSGVGPRTAQAIICEKGVKQVVLGIITSDITKIKVSGVGNKTAEKIIIMLKDKIKDFESALGSEIGLEQGGNPGFVTSSVIEDAINGLVSLGYSYADTKKIVEQISTQVEYETSSDLIKLALKKL